MKPADICTSWILLFYENVISGWVGISVFLNDRKNTDCCIILKLTGNARVVYIWMLNTVVLKCSELAFEDILCNSDA
mgnify:FL=1